MFNYLKNRFGEHSTTFDIDSASGTTGSTGGTETRPRNIAMIYMIKASHVS